MAHTKDAHPKTPTSVKTLQRFLKSNDEASDPKVHSELWLIIQRLRSLSMGAFGAKISVELSAPSEGLKISNRLKIIERVIRRAIADLDCPPNHTGLLLLVDQVEQIWSNDSASDTMVTGLLLAAKHVSKEFRGVRCAIFLRSDIYDALQFTEADKFHGDEMRIDWTPEALADLLLMRARASLGTEISSDFLWGKLFPRRIAESDADKYLISRTQMRPRDLIQFANACRDVAVQNRHTSVIPEDIHEAELRYSRWKLQDLSAEYRVNYPFLTQLFEVFRNSGYIVTRQLLEKRLAPALKKILRRYPEYASSLNPDDVIDILYGIGFLGVERNNGVAFIYDDPVLVEPGEYRFHIHPSVRPALRSESATDLRPYQSSYVISSHTSRQDAAGSNVGGIQRQFIVRGDIEYSTLDAIHASGTRISGMLDDPGLPRDVIKEVREYITRMLADAKILRQRITQQRITEGFDDETREIDQFSRWAVAFLSDLGEQLSSSPVGSEPRVQALCKRLESEAARLSVAAGLSRKAQRRRES